jgi:RNA polymerase sigma-70 factor (ECF subfamily)
VGSHADHRSDAELVTAALAGGTEAFEPIVRRFQEAVFAVALSRVGNFHDAQDTAQAVFLEAFRRLRNLKDPRRLGAWLRSITIHRSIDHLRGRSRVVATEEIGEMVQDRTAGPREPERRELRDQVMAAIGRLSRPQRETLTLICINGYSSRQVAAMQEIPVGTVRRRLHDARKRLKEEMMAMVEDVLKSEAPKEDFSEQVFRILSSFWPQGDQQRVSWHELVSELRRVGPQGIAGYARAFSSPHPPIRRAAARFLKPGHAPQKSEAVVQLLKKALKDTSSKVRRTAVGALLGSPVPEQRIRSEFVPLIADLLDDPSKRVRKLAAYRLHPYAADVPLATATRSLLTEEDRLCRSAKERLVRAILQAPAGDANSE